jgi:hypothetical protein
MKLLIFLAIIATVNSVNNITVISNITNTIYLAHTSNCLIYKLTNYNNIYTATIIVGQSGLFGDSIGVNGYDSLIKYPRNIIKNKDETDLFFIDNDNIIKNIKIQSNSIIGNNIEQLEITAPTSSIYLSTTLSYNYASSAEPDKYIYFVDSKCIYKVFINSLNDTIASSKSLGTGLEFVNISYNNNMNYLYYCYRSTLVNPGPRFHIKKSNNLHNFDYDNDPSPITIGSYDHLADIKSFIMYDKKLILTYGTSIYIYNTNNYFTYIFSSVVSISNSTITRFTTLIDYRAIYKTPADNLIIGRSTNKNFYKIKITPTNNIEVSSTDSIINMKANYSITVGTTDTILLDTDIIYNNKYLLDTVTTENIILYYNESLKKFIKYKCVNAEFKVKKLLIKKNGVLFALPNIVDIAINNLNTLYIANNTNIYTINVTSPDSNNLYDLITFYTNIVAQGVGGTIIKSIYYSNSSQTSSDDYLHYITNTSYNVITLKNKSISVLSNIVQTNATDSLSSVKDFVIDNNYEIGYIAFEKRLKWFYNI